MTAGTSFSVAAIQSRLDAAQNVMPWTTFLPPEFIANATADIAALLQALREAEEASEMWQEQWSETLGDLATALNERDACRRVAEIARAYVESDPTGENPDFSFFHELAAAVKTGNTTSFTQVKEDK